MLSSEPFTCLFPHLNNAACTGGQLKPCIAVFNCPLIHSGMAVGDNKLQPV